jgi:hypothetical protein
MQFGVVVVLNARAATSRQQKLTLVAVMAIPVDPKECYVVRRKDTFGPQSRFDL